MAKAYRCDLCNKFIDYCYSVEGIDIYRDELRQMGFDEDRKYGVNEICKECHDKIKKRGK